MLDVAASVASKARTGTHRARISWWFWLARTYSSTWKRSFGSGQPVGTRAPRS